MTVPLLQISNLGVTLGRAKILEDVTMTLERGTITALTGPNGAGKSTLLRSIAGLVNPSHGQILVSTHDPSANQTGPDSKLKAHPVNLRTLRELQRARILVWVPPSIHVPFSFTARQIVTMGRWSIHLGAPSRTDEIAVAKAMEQTGTTHLRLRPWNTLSTGESHLVQLARALAAETKILLLDEPAASLDPASVLATVKILRMAAAEGRAICLSLHDLSLARQIADHVLLLRQGRVIAVGEPAEALSPANIRRAFDVNATVVRTPAGRELLEFSSPRTGAHE